MKKNILFIIAFILTVNLRAQVGYHIQLASGTMGVLNNDSIYISSGVTDSATVMFANPNTKEWQRLNTNYLPNYGTPIIKDKNNGLLHIAGSGSIQVTSDGWQTVTTSTASLAYVNKCPANYYGHYNVGSNTKLVYSTNGSNWTNATMPGFLTILAARNYGNKIVALPGTVSSLIYISTDGGHTYTTAPNTTTFTGTFVDFYMASADTFLVFMDNKICKSYNSGATWTNTPIPGGSVSRVAFKNKNEFAIQTSSPQTFSYTTDGGITWQANINQPPVLGVGNLLYLNNYYYIYPWYRTNDLGATWDHFFPNMAGTAYSVDFNGNKGLLGLKSGKYSYSLDKGRSFKHFTNTISSNEDIMAAKVLSNGNFLAGDRKGQIYMSTDNGQTWVNKNTSGINLNSVRFLMSANENTIVLTRSGLPMVSTDAGATFSMVTYAINGGTHASAIKPNGQLMDARDVNGFEMRTFDQLGNTNVIYTYTSTGSESLAGFYMATDNVGYVMTRDNTNKINKIYKTTDGGTTFSPKTDIGQVVPGSSAYINTPFVSGIPLITCFGVDTIIITANFNNYYHASYDGGTTWNTITPPFVPGNPTFGNKIYRMHFFTSNSYIASTGDTFDPKGLYLNSQGVISAPMGIHELNFSDKKDKLVLFPNPSANTNLVSLLNLEEEAQVSIYNMSGQLVRSQITNSGTISIEELNEGLYIVRVQEKDKTIRTAKLLIQ
ncbi:MAG: T9SS type A sorting domain-containing protein [Bacteroidia bacterium]|nr:T9SS type A sorting domain-containing protein [Bacteroidia bacterium]